jgi:hypothetical protein
LVEEFLKHTCPVFVVLGTNGVNAKTGCGLTVGRAVIHKDCLFRKGLLTVKHHLEDLGGGLHDATFITEVHMVEEIADGMTLSIEVVSCPHHHKRVGVGEQAYLITLVAQQVEHVEITPRDMVHITMPGMITVVH